MKIDEYTVSYCYTSIMDLVVILFWLCIAIIYALFKPDSGTDIITFISGMMSLVTAMLKINSHGLKLDMRSRTITFLSEKKKPKSVSGIKRIVHHVRAKGRDEIKVFINAAAPKDFMISKEDYRDFASRISMMNPNTEIIDVPGDGGRS